MTLIEAIAHLREIIPGMCGECQAEHEELLGFLLELEEYREGKR